VRIGKGNRSTRRKLAPMPLCPPQIPHDMTRARTRAAALGSWRLTTCMECKPCSVPRNVEGFLFHCIASVL
jgi:hypothetical protein